MDLWEGGLRVGLLWGILLTVTVPLGIDAAFRAFFLLTRCWIRRGRDGSVRPSEARRLRFALVIPAHNEADRLAATLRDLDRLAYPRAAWQVFVVADACTDATAAVARQAGAVCWEKPGAGPQGKGRALQWAWEYHKDRLSAFDVLVVLDADSRVEPSFLTGLADAFHRGAERAQAWVQPVPEPASRASVLAAYSEWLSQEVDDRACRYWGWPVRFRGTGMAFRVDALRDGWPVLCTKAEDVELTLWGLRQGSIDFVPGAVVYDPKPATALGVTRQRARWLQGQWEVFRHYGRDIVRLLGRGIRVWACLLAILGRPKVGALMGRLCMFLLVISLPPAVGWLQKALSIFFGGSLLVDMAYYGLGLLWVERPGPYAKALIGAPLYVLLWLWSALVAVSSRHPWLRARD